MKRKKHTPEQNIDKLNHTQTLVAEGHTQAQAAQDDDRRSLRSLRETQSSSAVANSALKMASFDTLSPMQRDRYHTRMNGSPGPALPPPLAAAWHPVLHEADPRVRLQSLTNLLDLVSRWTVVLALAAHRKRQDGDLPDDLRARVHSLSYKPPTVGQWLGWLRQLVEHPGSRGCEVLQALGAVQARLDEVCPPSADHHQSTLELRNLLAHGSTFSAELSEELLTLHVPQMEGILHALADVPAVLQLNEAGTPGATRDPDTAWLSVSDGRVGLAPLIHHAPPAVLGGDGALAVLSPEPCVQLFSSAKKSRGICYTPIGARVPVTHHLDTGLLRERFGKRASEGAATDADEPRTFLSDARDEAGLLIGRKPERAALWAWVEAQRPWSRQPRLAWVARRRTSSTSASVGGGRAVS